MANTIITGASGFIGSHLVDKIARRNEGFIIGIDNLSNGSTSNIERHIGNKYFRFVKSDLKEPSSTWIEYIKDAGIIYHFATNPEVKLSGERPDFSFQDNNMVASFNLLEAMRKHDVKYLTATVDGRGWPGDVKQMLLDTSELQSTGWQPKYNSFEAVV